MIPMGWTLRIKLRRSLGYQLASLPNRRYHLAHHMKKMHHDPCLQAWHLGIGRKRLSLVRRKLAVARLWFGTSRRRNERLRPSKWKGRSRLCQTDLFGGYGHIRKSRDPSLILDQLINDNIRRAKAIDNNLQHQCLKWPNMIDTCSANRHHVHDMNSPAWDGYFRITGDTRNAAYQ